MPPFCRSARLSAFGPLPLLEPVRELLPRLGDGVARLLERALHPLAVVRGGAVALLAQRWLFAAAQVVAADDAVVVAGLHPVEQLAHPLDRQRMGDLQILEQAREPLE